MHKSLTRVLATLLAVLAFTVVSWGVWLGWDQRRDELPDGGSTGPYEAWQVIGLVLTLLAIAVLTVRYGSPAAMVPAMSLSLSGACYYDWSDDDSGLFIVGVAMVFIGVLFSSGSFAIIVAGRKKGGPEAVLRG